MLAQQAPLPIEGRGVSGAPQAAPAGSEPVAIDSRTRLLLKLGESRRGATWSGRSEDGALVAAKRLRAALTAPDLSLIARVANVDRSHLVPVRAVVQERGEQWVISELADGLSLRELARRGRPSTVCAVAIAMDILDGLAELHRAGLWHGAVHAGNVHVGADGTVRLSDYGLSMKGIPNEYSLRVADVSGVGVLLCRLLGVTTDAEGTPEGGSPGARQSKRSLAVGASPLGMAARQMAKTARNRRAAGYEAVQARLTLWEAAGRLANRRIHAQAKRRLAEMVAEAPPSRPRPAAPRARRQPTAMPARELVPALDRGHPVSSAPAPARSRPDGSPLSLMFLLAVIAACAGVALALTAPRQGGGVSPAVATRPCCSGAAAGASSPSSSRPNGEGHADSGVAAMPTIPPVQAAPEAAPSPLVEAPLSAGAVTNVTASLAPCGQQGICALHVEVWIVPASVARPVSWEVRSLAPCGAAPLVLATGYVLAQRNWTHVMADTAIRLTGRASESVVVITQQPDRAASVPILAGIAVPC